MAICSWSDGQRPHRDARPLYHQGRNCAQYSRDYIMVSLLYIFILQNTESVFSDWITNEMHNIDPDGFVDHAPTAKKVHQQPVVALGPHHQWSGDGHDKLNKIRFLIWAIQEVWSRLWLGLWVVPDNCLKVVIAYLYLHLVYKLGGKSHSKHLQCSQYLLTLVHSRYAGMPLLMVTDCGSEKTALYGFTCDLRCELDASICLLLINILYREPFSPELHLSNFKAHHFTKSIHNITMEWGWLQMGLQWGNNVIVFWEAGQDIYDPNDTEQ